MISQQIKNSLICIAMIMALLCQPGYGRASRKIHNKHYKFSITIPDEMVEIVDTSLLIDSKLYYDSTSGVIMMISECSSRFKSVNEYIDCGKQKLEEQLQEQFGDTNLCLINCSKSTCCARKINADINDLYQPDPNGSGMDTGFRSKSLHGTIITPIIKNKKYNSMKNIKKVLFLVAIVLTCGA